MGLQEGETQTTTTKPGARALEILERSGLRGLPESTRHALIDGGKVERLLRRQRIAQQGELAPALFLLGKGRVKLERASSGHVFPVGHRGPGDLVGEAALTGNVAPEHAIVADEVEALVIPATFLRRLATTDTLLQAVVARALLEGQRAAEDRLASLLLRSVRARLVELLLDGLDRWGEPHRSGTALSAPFTHADLASLIGSTRETVTLELGKLRRAKLIELDRRRIVILDRDALARYAETP
ncbi:Crp/Fnr family transcriptional regulator [Polyangium jinanense]|uniref:Crp/Fnr family transcriptional regulator n=1 Tax=Polyangium jinanense TaxID=2829994 RepID=A0A9X3WYY2_9BACT|nr:Crp/Fnr family transcriptional regulator [Polyangium jinanense]MDC3953561.1 Crp/Fnr family transcriptional regulator [Polyangium jinanense]MDC3979318.1 Crp/Fnr family transcriptional regulator [Polyangium jinanense]